MYLANVCATCAWIPHRRLTSVLASGMRASSSSSSLLMCSRNPRIRSATSLQQHHSNYCVNTHTAHL
jgi:hypothetical protein